MSGLPQGESLADSIPRVKIPLWLKLAYAAFLCVLVPVYWQDWGPANFLWLSDIALFLTAIAVIFEQPALAGMMAVGVLPLELAWCLDFVTGAHLIGLTDYMFDSTKTLFVRALSLFHIALPPTILWLLYRFGYDRRSFPRQVLLTWILLPLSYAVTDPATNVNWVFGPGNEPQHLVPPLIYLALEMVALPLFVLLPMHLILSRFFVATSLRH